MKNRLLALAVALLAIASSLQAVEHYEGNIFVGGKAGCTLSRTQFSPSVSQSMLPGFLAGVTMRYIEEDHFGLIAELNYRQGGWKEKFPEGCTLDYSRRIHYLQLPVLAHIYFGSPRVHFFVNAGPAVGVCLADGISANFDVDNLPANFPNPRQSDELSAPVTQKVDFGIAGGLGAEFFSNSRSSFNLEARLYYGLGNVFPCKRTDPFSAASGMSIEVALGYSFRLK